jgi:hypothetical protein
MFPHRLPSNFLVGTHHELERFPLGLSQKESEMSTFDERDTQRTGYDYSETPGGAAPAWILGSIVALAILGMVWYGVSGPARVGSAPDQPAIQHTAQPPAPTAPPVEPTTTPKP